LGADRSILDSFCALAHHEGTQDPGESRHVRKSWRIVCVTTLLASCVSSVSGAQQADSIAVGARVRLRTTTAAKWQYGNLGSVVRDSLELNATDYQRSRRFALRDVGPLEVYDPNERGRIDHALIGSLVGLVAGVAALVIDVKHCEATSHHSEGPPCAIGYTILPIAALGGAAVGTIVGAVLPVRHWRRISVDEVRR
jgi:hypothetical protein